MQQPGSEINHDKVRLPEIRTCIYETAGKELEAFGYKFRKSDFTFKKKKDKDFIQFIFIFHDYNPLNYDTSFGFNVFNSLIQEIKSHLTFNEFLGTTDWTSFQVPLGDFIDSEKGKAIKWRTNYTYYLYHRKHLVDAAEQMSKILKEEILPLCEGLFTIAGINDLFAKRGIQWSVGSLRINNMTADLISAKLSGKRDYHNVYTEMMTELKPMLNNGYHESAWQAMEDVYEYLKTI